MSEEAKPIIMYPQEPENLPFDTVDSIFTIGRIRYLDTADERGGCPMPRIRPIKFRDPEVIETEPTPILPGLSMRIFQGPEYHVESSFTSEEQYYISRCNRLFTRLINGETKNSKNEPLPSVSELAVNYYRKNLPRKKAGMLDTELYRASLSAAMEDSLRTFVKKYPSLLPAFRAMFANAGALGIAVAVQRCTNFLPDAKINTLTPETLNTYNKDNEDMRTFILTHPANSISNEKDSEVWCLGRSSARSILYQGKLTAIAIVSDEKVRNVPVGRTLTYVDPSFQEYLFRRIVTKAYHRAKIRQYVRKLF